MPRSDLMMPTPSHSLRARAADIIFGHETPLGKAFDVALIGLIGLSVLVVMLESVQGIRASAGAWLRAAEWIFTALFTIEYALRLWCAPSRWRYLRSFFGIVDVASILPTYLSLVLPGGQAMLTIRALRLLRVFRVLKLTEYVSEASTLMLALRASRRKITVFLAVVLTLVLLFGSAMYLVEGPESGFTSIPRSVYWGVVTLTTVGYGDIAPRTVLGQALASVIMILGYAIIAVPTGILTVELGAAMGVTQTRCATCGWARHDGDASYCKRCGQALRPGDEGSAR